MIERLRGKCLNIFRMIFWENYYRKVELHVEGSMAYMCCEK